MGPVDQQRNAGAAAANETLAATVQRAAHPLLRRLLELASFGIGFWLLTCILHSAPASADTAHPVPVPYSHQHPGPLGGLRTVALPHVPALTRVATQPVKAIEHMATHLQRDLHTNVRRLTRDTAHVVTGSMNAVRAMTHQATDRLASAQRALHLTTSNSASQGRQHGAPVAHRRPVRISHRSVGVAQSTVPAPHATSTSASSSSSTRANHHATVATGRVHRVLGTTPTTPRPNVPAAPGAGGAQLATGSIGTQLAAALTPVANAEPGEHRSHNPGTHSRLLGIAADKPTFSPD